MSTPGTHLLDGDCLLVLPQEFVFVGLGTAELFNPPPFGQRRVVLGYLTHLQGARRQRLVQVRQTRKSEGMLLGMWASVTSARLLRGLAPPVLRIQGVLGRGSRHPVPTPVPRADCCL